MALFLLVAWVRRNSAQSTRETLLRSHGADAPDRMTAWSLEEMMNILEVTWMREVYTKTDFTR